MKAFELSFNLIALFIMGLLVVVLVAGHFTGQSSQIFSKISGFGKTTTGEQLNVAFKVCTEMKRCEFSYEDYVNGKAGARTDCDIVKTGYGGICSEKDKYYEWTATG